MLSVSSVIQAMPKYQLIWHPFQGLQMHFHKDSGCSFILQNCAATGVQCRFPRARVILKQAVCKSLVVCEYITAAY